MKSLITIHHNFVTAFVQGPTRQPQGAQGGGAACEGERLSPHS